MTVLITLTTIGIDCSTFDIYSNVDGFVSAFETDVPKASLSAGFSSANVPNGTSTIRIKTKGLCSNHIDLNLDGSTTTTTTTVVAPTCIYLDYIEVRTKYVGPPPESVSSGANITFNYCNNISENIFIVGATGSYDPLTGEFVNIITVESCIQLDSLNGPIVVNSEDGWTYTIFPTFNESLLC